MARNGNEPTTRIAEGDGMTDKDILKSMQSKLNTISDLLSSLSDDIDTIEDTSLKNELGEAWLKIRVAKGAMNMVIRKENKKNG